MRMHIFHRFYEQLKERYSHCLDQSQDLVCVHSLCKYEGTRPNLANTRTECNVVFETDLFGEDTEDVFSIIFKAPM